MSTDSRHQQHVLGPARLVHDARASRLRLLRRDEEDESSHSRGHHETRSVSNGTTRGRTRPPQRQEDVRRSTGMALTVQIQQFFTTFEKNFNFKSKMRLKLFWASSSASKIHHYLFISRWFVEWRRTYLACPSSTMKTSWCNCRSGT